MKLRDYLSEERGRLSALANSIGAYKSDLSRWADGKRPVPIPYGLAIESATNGAVTRKDLFPDVWEKVWPDLADQKAGRRRTDKQTP